jgi:hypothetical protein
MWRRLSYANLMATLAFFFALSGGAMAVNKYLTANDPITSGDLAGSTYGAPVIANGVITSAKFNASAVAPNSLLLNGHAATDFPRIVASGSDTLGGGVGANLCTHKDLPLPSGVDPATDYVVVQPDTDVATSLSVSGVFASVNPSGVVPAIKLCNPTTNFQDFSGTYRYIILR